MTIDILAQRFLRKEAGPLQPEEAYVLQGIHNGIPTSRHAADIADERSSYGEHLSDRVAAVGGSWGFIIAFSVILLSWMLLNSGVLQRLISRSMPILIFFSI